MVEERALLQPAGLKDAAPGPHRVAALGELGEGRRPDRFDRRPLLALGNDRHGRHPPYRLALGGHRAPPAMPSTIFQASSAAGRTSLPDSAARTLAAVPSSARA